MKSASLAIVLLLGATGLAQVPPPARFDLVIRGGTVIDGSGGAPFRADVGVIGRYIARVGDLSRAEAAVTIDATGLYVTPGFINIHSHAQPAALASAENMLTQGVTLEIVNADGSGTIDIGKQLTDLAAAGLAINVGANIGFNSAWTTVVGETDRRPTPEDVKKMQQIVVANLEQGAWGVSAGLDYKPAYFSTTEEVIDVVRAAAPYRTNFINHDRITPESNFSSRVGMTETMAIGARAGLMPVITHMKVQGREQGTAGAFLKTMTDATARGRYTAADAYPYLAGQTGLAALIIPGWAQDGGRARMLERFKDTALRAKIVAETEAAMQARFGGPEGVYLPSLKRELTDIMKELAVSGGEAVVRTLEQGSPGIIARFGLEADLIKILQHPATSIACDCGAALPGVATHPRYYGTFPRVLGHYVRETKALAWPDAIRKMTLLPAATIGLVDRGAIAPGMAADIVVFDPNTVIDHATFEQPTLKSEGIRHVIVNGIVALQDGVVTGRQTGAALMRSKHMPSRPLVTTGARRAAVRMPQADATAWRFDLDLAQAAGARQATGKFTAIGPGPNGVRLSVDTGGFGMLQVANNWASFTARAFVGPSRVERTIVVIVEGKDPWSGDGASLTIAIDGDPSITAPLPAGSVTIR
jgi:N-acyl-D-aspartate/D-glutamate deacylase